MIKISVITVCYNAADTIEDNLLSVAGQSYRNIEHIVIDGMSGDGTFDIVKRHTDSVTRAISEPDDGIYEAMNKGIALATGDVIVFLNADDVYAHNRVLETVAGEFRDDMLDACFGDVVFVKDDLETVVRHYRSSGFTPEKLAYGWMPAHPALFLRKRLIDAYGDFKTDYRIAADYELVVRIFGKGTIRYRYLDETLVKMRMGGLSTRGIRSSWILNTEIVRACRENGISTNLAKVFLKVPRKIMEYIVHSS